MIALRKKSTKTLAIDARLAAETLDAVKQAHHFTCTIFVNRGYRTFRAGTLDEARSLRAAMEAKANNGRMAMIYAVTVDGKTFFVPPSFPASDL